MRAAPDYRLRPMDDAADLAFVRDVYASARAEELEPTGWPAEQKQAFLSQQHEAQHVHYRRYYPKGEWLIIERGGERVGRLYREEWTSEIRIIDIALLPAARGAGIGADIVRTIQREAAGRGKGVSIHVEKNNPARRLYDRLGFEVAEDKGVYFLLRWTGTAPREAVS